MSGDFRKRTTPVGIAAVYAVQRHKEAVYHWLREAIDAGLMAHREIERHFCFAAFHGEPRLQQMMAEIKVKPDTQRERVSELEKE